MKQQSAHDDAQVAKRLRVVRKSKGFSQRELAKRAGVGSGTISLIESSSTQPSVAVLKKILDGVPLDLASFFSFELDKDVANFFLKGSHVDIGMPGLEYLLVAAQRPGRKLQVLHEFYEPGKASGRVHLSHEGEECAIVIRGELEVTIGDDTRVLQRGDAYYFDSTVPHSFRNVGNEKCEVVSVCTPPTF